MRETARGYGSPTIEELIQTSVSTRTAGRHSHKNLPEKSEPDSAGATTKIGTIEI